MALGSVTSMGVASGVLTKDLFDQLKGADESAQVKPYDTKLEKNTAKQTALTELLTKLTSFKSAVSSLGDSTAFANRKVDSSVSENPAATLTASSGVSLQDLEVEVMQIARNDVYQSKGFNKDTDTILSSLSSGTKATFTLIQNGKEYSIEVDSTTTFRQLADKINTATDGNIQAKIINTGEKTNPYRLTLTSKDTGLDNSIGFYAGTKDTSTGIYTESAEAKNVLSALGWNLKSTGFSAENFTGFNSSSAQRITLSNGSSESLGLQNDIKFTLFVGEESFEIDARTTDTYDDLINRVNSVTGGKVQLSAAKNVNNEFSFSFSAGVNAPSGTKVKVFDGVKSASGDTYETSIDTSNFLSQKLGINVVKSYGVDDANGEYHIKKAQDAIFVLDGVRMVRSSNEVKDIGAGLTLSLKKEGEVNFSVKQDVESIKETMNSLVESFNELTNFLTEATKYDIDTGVAGDLQGVTEVTSLRSNILSALFQTQMVDGVEIDENENERAVKVMTSLNDFGLTLNESGLLTFDSSKFDEKVNEDISFAEKFFSGVSGFEDINYIGSSVKLDQDIDFKDSGFKITFNDKTYDLSKDADGNEFTLTGADAAERAKNLVDHINSFNIEDLEVSIEEISVRNGSSSSIEYILKFNSDNGSDFKVEGKETFLQNLGLEATQISPQYEEGTGIFASLKQTLDAVNGKNGSLTLYETALKDENKKLTESKKNSQERIDAKYETLQNTWVQYEIIMSKLNAQSNAISQMVAAMSSSDK